jgi:hypothetical protein
MRLGFEKSKTAIKFDVARVQIGRLPYTKLNNLESVYRLTLGGAIPQSFFLYMNREECNI